MATVKQQLSIGDAIPHATLIPELCKIDGTNFPIWGYAFASGSLNEQLSWRYKASNYGASNPSVLVVLHWYSRSGSTTGSPTWGAAFSVLTPGDAQSMETDTFATEVTAAVAVNGTAKGLTVTTITITNTNLDSMTADDSVEMRIRRTDNSMTGDAILVGIEVQYSDT
jgi:hypothetical protein